MVNDFDPRAHEAVIRDFLQAVVDQDVYGGQYQRPYQGRLSGASGSADTPGDELGVKLTIGSDSHRPGTVGQFFDTIQPMLYAEV